jgi:hypothetical protein
MSKIKIEKNVPMPTRSNVPELPLDQMEVGDSFAYELQGDKDYAVVRQRLTRYQKSNPPVRFSMKKVSETEVRVHRIEDA